MKSDFDKVLKSIAPSCIENLLTDVAKPIHNPSMLQFVYPGAKKLIPLHDKVVECYINERDSLLKSKPPFLLLPLSKKEGTALPFLWISAAIHPYPKPERDTSPSRLTKMKSLEVSALYDTGSKVMRVCGDVIGVALEQGEVEPCIFTFEYLPFRLAMMLMVFLRAEGAEFKVCGPVLIIVPRRSS